MINQITCNSNNTIELSRGELLQWINNMLKINYTKIEQFGTGAAYCQILDMMYPGKVPMGKVNWRAKTEYQYINNFKVLQQCFVKLHILRNIEVQKLIKCKVQDNLEFLQWFKKIYDNTCNGSNKEYDAATRRGEKNQQTVPNMANTSNSHNTSKQKNLNKENRSNSLHRSNTINISQHEKSFENMPPLPPGMTHNLSHSNKHNSQIIHGNYAQSRFITEPDNDKNNTSNILAIEEAINSPTLLKEEQNHNQDTYRPVVGYAETQKKFIASNNNIDIKLLQLVNKEHQDEEKQFYLRKMKEIEHLMEDWDTERKSGDLMKQIRKIIFMTQEVQWKVENGELIILGQEQQESTQKQQRKQVQEIEQQRSDEGQEKDSQAKEQQ